MKRWLDEQALRLAYQLLRFVRRGDHSQGFHELVNDAQGAVAEVVTLYYPRTK